MKAIPVSSHIAVVTIKAAVMAYKEVLRRQRVKHVAGDIIFNHYTAQMDLCNVIYDAVVFKE